MFLKQTGSTRGVEPVFSEKDQAINPHRKRESRRDVSGCTLHTIQPVDNVFGLTKSRILG
jgi:hypothetical protein